MIHVLSADLNRAAVSSKLAADDRDGRGLARAVDAEKGEQLTLPDVEGEVAHRLHLAEALIQVLNFNNMFHWQSHFLKSGDWLRSTALSAVASGTGWRRVLSLAL